MRRRLSGTAAVCALAAGLVGCGDAPPTATAGGSSGLPVATDVLVAEEEVAVVRRDGTVATVGHDGRPGRALVALPPDAGEPDAVAVGPDGRLVVVSTLRSDDDDPAVCAASVLQVLPDGSLSRLAEGASVALSADGRRMAFFRYAVVDGFCRRTDLVARDLETGADTTVAGPGDGEVGGTPPTWPVSWAPDGSRIAHVTREGAVVTDVATGRSTPVRPVPGLLAPAFLADGRLVGLDGCCIGGAAVATAEGEQVFAVDAPVRSIRAGRDGVGAWFTLEDVGLHRWDGATTRAVTADAVLTSG